MWLCQCTCLCLHTSGTTSCFNRYCFNKKKYLVMFASLDSSAPPVSTFQIAGITGVCYHTYPQGIIFKGEKIRRECICKMLGMNINQGFGRQNMAPQMSTSYSWNLWQHTRRRWCNMRWYSCYRIKTLSGLPRDPIATWTLQREKGKAEEQIRGKWQ